MIEPRINLGSALNHFRRPKKDTPLPNAIKRCFITGKQCTFLEKILPPVDAAMPQPLNESIFVIMPFRDNLEAMFEWTLQPFIQKACSNIVSNYLNATNRHSEINVSPLSYTVERADRLSKMGYVMCERICQRIQQASLICVDLSLPNPNVYYELGLATGLEKPILLFCENQKLPYLQQSGILSSVTPKDSHNIIITYSGLNEIAENISLDIQQKIIFPTLSPIIHPSDAAQIITLVVNDDGVQSSQANDISVSFTSALTRAISIAITESMENNDSNTHVLPLVHSNERSIVLWSEKDQSSKMTDFEKVENVVAHSFCTIVDLGDENPISYFWLGYCHSRGINVIPISRAKSIEEGRRSTSPEKEHERDVLAFDLRALWYIEYSNKEVTDLSRLITGALKELRRRDLTFLQRDIFWDRFAQTGHVDIFVGALHNDDYNREMIGDWDLRTVSELVEFLSSNEVAIRPHLHLPVYSPSMMYSKASKVEGDPPQDFLNRYKQHLHNLIYDKNCIIVATPESNPLTEYVLSYAYFGSDHACFVGEGENYKNKTRNCIIALKDKQSKKSLAPGHHGSVAVGIPSRSKIKQSKGLSDQNVYFPTFFCRETKEHFVPTVGLEGGRSTKIDNVRGFLVKGVPKVLEYISQEKFAEQRIGSRDFDHEHKKNYELLGHLLIMKNPFGEQSSENPKFIVVLNGISGPATLGLAQILTARNNNNLTKSQSILEMINKTLKLNEINRTSNQTPDNCIEALIKIILSARQHTRPENRSNSNDLDDTISYLSYDTRSVSDFDLYRIEGEENPRKVKKENYDQ